ncbi:hypothetical protein MHUMG1_02714 [Metarhizium humberi]|uniref:Uncharacterized protein n=1 Tax=Metarhizium humberi TaxID=2596975 RepID=A0A9P8S9P5_9HYPO|nr:hypothetical protein MHUMG1_02714 [Metarhizium humberi]
MRAITIIVTGYRGQHTVSPQHSRSVKSLFRLGASWPTEAHLVKPHGQAPNNGESAAPLLGSRLQSTKTFGHNAQSYLALNYAPYQATASSTTRSISIRRLFEPPDAISACWRALVYTPDQPHKKEKQAGTLSRARDMRPSAGLVAYPQLSPSKGTNTTENRLLPQPRSTLDLAELIQNDPVPRSTMRVILGAVIHTCADKNDSSLEPPATKPIFASWAENNEGQGAGRRHMTRNQQ